MIHLKKLIHPSKNNTDFKPIFYRIKNDAEREELLQLIASKPYIKIYDEIKNQLAEYIKIKFPNSAFDQKSLEKEVEKYKGNLSYDVLGVWVYYPWSEKIVHILDQEEFVEVRTNRNQYKITPDERSILSGKIVGVIGLSVGQSVSVTLSMERSYGELRIADFDIIELSNLNRIRTGVQNIGIPKVVIVAREIAEIDPYLKVTPYFEGITEENIDGFLTDGGKLDLLFDECDSLNIKLLCRLRAKEFSIPVLMETSDRGMIDIERFDLEPYRPIFHGILSETEIGKAKQAIHPEEKIPFILTILGKETVSKRLQMSILELRKTIITWPQLASSVTMGGGIGADIARKIFLNQLNISGRFFIDLDELISDKTG